MANVITSFLVGIGYDVSELRRGEREISTSMEGVKSLAGTTGAALSAAFIGVGATASQTAERVNNLRLNTNQLYTSTQYVNDYGNALRSLGGNATDAVSEITRVETAINNLRNKGDASAFTDLAYYGVQIDPLKDAESGGQFMERLSEQFPGLNRDQQQGVANTLGLSPATVELLRKGSDGYRDVLNHVHEVAGLSDDLIEKSRQYNAAIGEAQNRWEGVANTISSAVLPGMTDIINKGSDILSNVVAPMAERDPVATGAGLSMLGAGIAGSVAAPLLGAAGLGGVGALAGAVAPPVALAGAGTLAWNMNQQDVQNLTGAELPSWLWDKKVFDESQGDMAGGMIHSDSLLGKGYDVAKSIWNADQSSVKEKTGYELPGWLFEKNIGGQNNNSPDKARPQTWDAGDALNQDYESQKRAYIDTSNYAPEAQVNDYNSAAAVGQAVAEKLYAVPLKATVTNNVDMRVELDGRALDSKITEVQQRNNQMTVDDMQSTTAR
jgi:hypothetical protein